MRIINVILLGLFLSLFMSRIFVMDAGKELIGDYGDKYEFYTYMHLVKENIREGKYPLSRTDILRYPVGFEFGHGYDGVLSVFSGALLGFFLPLPLAYNISLVLILFLNFILTFASFARITGSRLFGVFAGIFFGLSPYVIARINGHANLAFIGGFPVLLMSMYSVVGKIKNRSGVRSADILLFLTGVLLIAFGSLQYLIVTFWITLIYFVTFFLFYTNGSLVLLSDLRKDMSGSFRLNYKLLLAAFTCFTLTGMFFFWGYIKGFLFGSFVYPFNYEKYVLCCLPQLSDIFVPNRYAGAFWSYLNSSPPSIEKVVSLGMIEWLVVVYVFMTEKIISRKIVWLILFAVYLFFTLGIVKMPFWPEGGRSVVVFTLISLIFISNKLAFDRKGLYILISLLILERIFFSVYQTVPLPWEMGQVVKAEKGKAVLNIPLTGSHAYRSALTTVYGKKIVDGYFHDTAENEQSLSFLSQSLMERYFCNYEKHNPDELVYDRKDYKDTLELLRKNDIRTIVLHKDNQYEKFYYDECVNVRFWWIKFNPQTLILESDLPVEVKTTMELYRHPVINSRIFFKTGGTFRLSGIYLNNGTFTDTHVTLPDNSIMGLEWKNEGEGIRSVMEKPLELTVKPGDELIVSSDKIFDGSETVYLTFYYSFDSIGSTQVSPPVENIYSSDAFEIYRVN